jgi:hypothetical protein
MKDISYPPCEGGGPGRSARRKRRPEELLTWAFRPFVAWIAPTAGIVIGGAETTPLTPPLHKGGKGATAVRDRRYIHTILPCKGLMKGLIAGRILHFTVAANGAAAVFWAGSFSAGSLD